MRRRDGGGEAGMDGRWLTDDERALVVAKRVTNWDHREVLVRALRPRIGEDRMPMVRAVEKRYHRMLVSRMIRAEREEEARR